MLILDDVTVRMAGKLLIDHSSAILPEGSKTGFVGHNGTGKSTLFKAIVGELSTETGKIVLPKGAKIGQVAQEAPATAQSLIEIVLEADKERNALMQEAETATDPMRIAEIHIRLADIDAHSAEARASTILSGLGFDNEAQLRPASSFSGGWRMRVALAAVLFAEPDILLLDEPTNYLDLEGIVWLIDYIKKYPHTVVIISHDRDLLNSAATSILHLENQKLTFWRGNYDQFERQRAETMELQQKQAVKQEAKKSHMEAFVARFRAKATKAKQAQSRLKALEKLKPITVWKSEGVEPFSFPNAEKVAASPIIALSNVDVGYEPNKPILKNLDLRIDNDDRIALLGSNGNGKSTFAKLIAGRLKGESGTITLSPNLKVAFFAQHQLDDLYPDENAIEHVRRLMPQEPEAKIRSRVARMGLSTAKMMTKAKELSGGEKARLLMGLATFDGPNLLILDEPTNHLDIDSRAELVEALNDFNGAVILIAHDRHLIDATMDRLWIVRDGGVGVYEGDMDAYRIEILNSNKSSNSKKKVIAEPEKPKSDQRKLSADKRQALAPLRKEIQKYEANIEKLQKKIASLDTELSDGSLYTSSPDKASQKSIERANYIKQLEESETNWLLLTEEYEAAIAE
ncbi:ABC-F family ATP-binding cassette domain-containing protein [Bartonella sp. HY329]|uniref:ABC-F family ATP-binding cassette domain-containing protein n=1 Tax=unclassified Bartonella TaxID=2645622 RepID=UPI0021C93CC6|nr:MULTISPECIES: ABC-F family ATP-binding cassette domain-containing protein [unclassified Bartonella]UXM96267.1 ABC-F family ATP-binding cassette domain-containing protein [Bartonella sp. HY329]UXN10591.1 ABC-F family ATP-binding cassette domain-containing protein [Bartonella sp. HY328]